MIKIGVLATLVGPFRVMGEDAVRGAQLALAEFEHQVAAMPLDLVIRPTNAIGDSAANAAIELLDLEGCDFIVGPLAGDEGLAIRELARRRPADVFINGTSASQAIFNPAANFYAFCGSGVQWMAGFGEYCYQDRGYRRILTIGQAYSYPFAQVGGFALEFCRAGGEIVDMIWSSLGTEDFSPFVEKIPQDIDAVLSVLAGPDFVNFVHAYRQSGRDMPINVGQASGDTITLEGLRDYADWLVGMQMAGPVVTDNPSPLWWDFVEQYRAMFPAGHYAPSLYATAYYTAVKAGLLALDAINGDLSGERQAFQQALSALEFETPTGPVRLDHHNLPIVNNFVGEIDLASDGTLYTRHVRTVPEVNATLSVPEAEYLRMGEFNIHNMPCQKKIENPDSFEARLRQRRPRSEG